MIGHTVTIAGVLKQSKQAMQAQLSRRPGDELSSDLCLMFVKCVLTVHTMTDGAPGELCYP